MITSYGEINEGNEKSRTFLNFISQSDLEPVDALPYLETWNMFSNIKIYCYIYCLGLIVSYLNENDPNDL